MKNNTRGIFITAAVIILFFLAAIFLFNFYNQPKTKKYNDFMYSLSNKEVESMDIDNDTITYKLKNDNTKYKTYGRTENIDEYLLVIYGPNTDNSWPSFTLNNRYATNIWTVLNYVLIFGLGIFLILIIFRGMGAGDRKIVSFGKSGINAQTSLKVRFNDVAGAEEEKEELAEIVEFLKAPQKFILAGARIPRGVLLVGPPGTGKTLFAKAVAGEANVPFFSISGSDFVEMYVGVGASRVRDLFEVAKKHKPCIIFIDEIDAVGRQRGAGLGGGHDEREQTLNQLLVQMDGFQTTEEIIIMAATNRADILDPALLRPGRFDRQIYVNVPDVRGREEIFKVHARNKQIHQDVDYKTLARITSGFTGADIANLLNEAAILCARANRTQIIMADILEGINKVTLGPQKKSRLVTEVDKRITAYHEAGHAIVAKSLPFADPVHEVSIIPRGMAGGYTMMRPEDDNNHTTVNRLTAYITMLMGGRAAEELVIKDVTNGPSHDIKTATGIAKKMVTEWGMSKLGPIYYGGDQEVFLGRSYGSSHSYSESAAAKIDLEVNGIVEKAHKTAIDILTKEKEKLDVMVRVLIEAETIFSNEVDLIMQGKSAIEVIESIKEKNNKAN